MRLIDAERLMYSLRGNVLIDVVPELEETIAQQPTAFDKEKVIKELRHASKVSREHWQKYDDSGAFHEMRAFESAIEIVKKGGIE